MPSSAHDTPSRRSASEGSASRFMVATEVRTPAHAAIMTTGTTHAAPCPIAVKQRILDVFPPGTVWEFYGASEGGGTRIGPGEWLERPGSVGRPWPGLDALAVVHAHEPQR